MPRNDEATQSPTREERRTHFELEVLGRGSRAFPTSAIRAGIGLFHAWLMIRTVEDARAIRDAIKHLA